MSLTDEQRERKRELEHELADLRREDDRPLTRAEIDAMSPEEVTAAWEQVKQTLASAPTDDTITRATSRARLRAGYEQAGDPTEVRLRRRNKLPEGGES